VPSLGLALTSSEPPAAAAMAATVDFSAKPPLRSSRRSLVVGLRTSRIRRGTTTA
jgi:hypothetical protein